ncbi:Mss4-like protein [Phaeosphaeria sp. MPI-PUGE-AT-0046c]|nr:Mss4-like protein [Phaeosphaeria sp. MPI-PUGE-AT-0046c]
MITCILRFQTRVPQHANENSKPKHKPFPTVTGGCICSTIRYRLLSSPLFCYACHCPDCQRSTGSAFGLFLNIESSRIKIISPTRPVPVVIERRPGLVSRHVECPKCKCELWAGNMLGPAICDVRVGTLDYPSLMEPDVHSFVESRLEWVRLPEGATTTVRGFEHRKLWPEASLRRLDSALARWAQDAAALTAAAAVAKGGVIAAEEGRGGEDVSGGDGEKTPTAGEFGAEGEDDEAFEKRFRETERALQERLEKLSEKLAEENGKRRQSHLEDMTANLQIGDDNSEDDVRAKDGIVAPTVD